MNNTKRDLERVNVFPNLTLKYYFGCGMIKTSQNAINKTCDDNDCRGNKNTHFQLPV